MKTWTDYPFASLGDDPDLAPIRECKVLAYDGDKYFTIDVNGVRETVKRFYVYTRPGRLAADGFWCREGGRLPNAPCLTRKQLRSLPRSS